MHEFSNNSLSPSCRIFYDLNTTPNFQLSKILNFGIQENVSKLRETKLYIINFSYF